MSVNFEHEAEKCNNVRLQLPPTKNVDVELGDIFVTEDEQQVYILSAFRTGNEGWQYMAVHLANGNRFRNPLPTMREATEYLRWLGRMDITIKPKG